MFYQFNLRAGKLLSVFSLSFISILLLTSCKGPKAATAEADTLPDALLWKIEHKDLKAPSYLFGTIHMIPEEDFFLPDGLEEAFEKSERVVFEIDMDDMSDMGSLMGMMSGLMMKDGMTLQKLLTPAEYQEVSEYFEAMGMPMFLLGNVKPMFLSMLAALYDKANETSKQVGGLETMAYQMSLFDSIPYKDQAVMLLDAVRGTNQESDMFEETVELYKLQKIEAMVAMVGESDENADGNYEDVLLNNRNQNWIPAMKKKMSKASIFFAVGAGHLGGEQGVIRLLRKEGYTVTPVSVYRQTAPKKI